MYLLLLYVHCYKICFSISTYSKALVAVSKYGHLYDQVFPHHPSSFCNNLHILYMFSIGCRRCQNGKANVVVGSPCNVPIILERVLSRIEQPATGGKGQRFHFTCNSGYTVPKVQKRFVAGSKP